ncbi:glycosyltransferase involved in cell wall biosynthesis [Leptothrix sp. C29]|uniref:Glycosyltransferase involved in cell wall biosynthesis n=1 Tax=Sphaerotilus uruguayifluvii TaxID=2735897 RepID=A0ABX2G3J9_9BURK|nr:glycosyltransferase involved in cell wall biosynthesis [Leptothrix sp. C29]
MNRIAIVHEWFTTMAGSEKVVEQICHLYPEADVFAVFADPDMVSRTRFLQGRRLRTTFIQDLPKARTAFRSYLPLMPLAVEQLDLSGYDLVISSAHAVAKGVLTGPDQLHISYVHSPIRYAWDLQHQYLRESGLDRGLKGWIAKWMLHKIRLWDYRTAAGVDHFVANSRFIGRRIHKVYGRSADVIYPPVDVDAFELCADKDDYYLTASRLVPYKRMDLIVQAFAQMPDKRLVVIGDGPEMPKLKAAAAPNIELLGYQEFSVLKHHLQCARAFVFAAEEDFGITPVEAQACGTPVIAFGRGGALETVVMSPDPAQATGVFFPEQTVESLVEAVRVFESHPEGFRPEVCRRHAERFSVDQFRQSFSAYVTARVTEFRESLR